MNIYRPTIYTASKLRHHSLWRDLRAGRLEFCDFHVSWIDSPEAQKADDGRANPLVLSRAWITNIREASKADYTLVYCPDGDESLLRGTLVEVGAALGSGRNVIFIGETDASWTYHPAVAEVRWIDEAILLLQKFARAKNNLFSRNHRLYEGK